MEYLQLHFPRVSSHQIQSSIGDYSTLPSKDDAFSSIEFFWREMDVVSGIGTGLIGVTNGLIGGTSILSAGTSTFSNFLFVCQMKYPFGTQFDKYPPTSNQKMKISSHIRRVIFYMVSTQGGSSFPGRSFCSISKRII